LIDKRQILSYLLDKLYRQFQFTNSAVKLVRSYLCDRSQIVLANGSCLQEAFTFTGVPLKMSTKLTGRLVSNIINDWALSIRNFVLLMITKIGGSLKSFKKAYHSIFNENVI
jgi:hypothetical protein